MNSSVEKDIFFLKSILDAIDGIALHQKSSVVNYTINRAVVFEIMTIGEAVKHLSSDIKKRFTQIDWKSIAATRNKIVHEYFQIDEDIIANIIEQHLPDLRKDIKDILEVLSHE